MNRGIGATIGMVVVGVLSAAAILSADRLVLRDGRRIEGQLLSVQRGVIEFREDRGRVIQVPRDDVDRIELQPAYTDMRDYRDNRDNRDNREPDRSGNRPRPNGMREREVWVSAKTPWTDTGIDLRGGQPVYFDTHGGDIEWKRGSHARAAGDDTARYDANRPIPSRPIGALIGKVTANSRDYFYIGEDQGPLRARADGRLFLGINDSNLTDNQGAFRVTVYY